MKWLTSPMSPQVIGAATTPLNPGLYPSWAVTGGNPTNYGPWGGFLSQPAGGLPFNPADLMKVMPIPMPTK
jgi:hypothetical protein